jgi:SAM-dependent methyltransferase
MPRYRTWLRPGRLYTFVVLSVLSLAGCVLVVVSPWFLLFLVPLAAFGYITVILLGSAYRLGPGGAQWRIHEMIARRAGSGRVLDVGCGSGSLSIKIAKAWADATVTGVDSWGPSWQYSRQLCEDNARAEGVDVTFLRQDAAALDFADDSFDVVVSCMTLHEVSGGALAEALRVLRPGGRFVLVDPFADGTYYPSFAPPPGTEEFTPLAEQVTLPFPLRHPRVLGRTMLLTGTKPA